MTTTTVSYEVVYVRPTSSPAYNFIGAGAGQTNDQHDVFNTLVESVIKEDYISLIKLFRLQQNEIEVHSIDKGLDKYLPEHRKMTELAFLTQKMWLKIYKEDFAPNLETAKKFALENQIPFNFDELLFKWFPNKEDYYPELVLFYIMHDFTRHVSNYQYEHPSNK